jgi:hypothetical protein
MGTRILFISTLVLALTLAAAIPQFGRDGRMAPSGADHGKHSLAINILRAINTTELDHRMKHGLRDLGRTRDHPGIYGPWQEVGGPK